MKLNTEQLEEGRKIKAMLMQSLDEAKDYVNPLMKRELKEHLDAGFQLSGFPPIKNSYSLFLEGMLFYQYLVMRDTEKERFIKMGTLFQIIKDEEERIKNVVDKGMQH